MDVSDSKIRNAELWTRRSDQRDQPTVDVAQLIKTDASARQDLNREHTEVSKSGRSDRALRQADRPITEAEVRAQEADLRGDVEEAEADVAEAEQDVAIAEDDLKDARAEREARRNDLDHANARAEEARRKHEHWKAQRDADRQAVREARSELKDAKAELKALEAAGAPASEIAAAEARVEAAQSKLATAKAEMKGSEAHCNRCQQELEAAQADAEAAQADFDAAEQAEYECVRKLGEMKAELHLRKQALEKAIDAYEEFMESEAAQAVFDMAIQAGEPDPVVQELQREELSDELVRGSVADRAVEDMRRLDALDQETLGQPIAVDSEHEIQTIKIETDPDLDHDMLDREIDARDKPHFTPQAKVWDDLVEDQSGDI